MHAVLSYISRFLLVQVYIIDHSACWIPSRLTGYYGSKVRSRHVAFKSAPHKSGDSWFFNFHAHRVYEMDWGKSHAMSMKFDSTKELLQAKLFEDEWIIHMVVYKNVKKKNPLSYIFVLNCVYKRGLIYRIKHITLWYIKCPSYVLYPLGAVRDRCKCKFHWVYS